MKESVQALRLRTTSSNPTTITVEQLRRFPRLKFLCLSDVVCEGDFTGCLSKLKWIILTGKTGYSGELDSQTNLGLENMVVMNILSSDLSKDEISYLIKGATKLKILTPESNYSIHGTPPTFPEYLVLEKLIICHCPSLKGIDRSIGKLRQLTDLSIKSCPKLEKLLEEIGELQNLRHLSICKCNRSSELPNSVSKYESSTKLDIPCTTRLLGFIGRQRRLSSAKVSHTPIVELPSIMSKLLHLQTLNLQYCHKIKVVRAPHKFDHSTTDI